MTVKLSLAGLDRAVPPEASSPVDLAALGERMRPSLVRLGAAVTGEPDVGDDLAQEALTALHARTVAPEHPEAWLRSVVVNQGRTWVRRKGLHRRYLQRWEAWRSVHRVRSDEPDLADQFAVRSALARLSPDHRAVLVLRFYDDLTVPQVAQTLGISEGTVKSRLHRGLQELRKGMTDD